MSSAEPVDYADEDALVTGEAVALDLRPAPFVFRGASALIDVVVSALGFLGILLVLNQGFQARILPDALAVPIIITAYVFCFVAVPLLVELITRGKSLGRLALGIRIVRDDGGAAGFRQAFVRAIVGSVEYYVLLGGPAALTGALTPRSKRLGDLLAGTYGQYERLRRRPEPVFGVPVPLLGWATTADVARLPDRLSRRIAQFLAQARKLEPGRRAQLAGSLASEAATYVSPVPQADAELFLAAVAVLRREREARALSHERQRMATLAPVLETLPHRFPDRG